MDKRAHAKRKKRKRAVKPVTEVRAILQEALKTINSSISALDAAQHELDDAKEEVREASHKAEVVADALRERIDKLTYPKKG